MDVSAHRMGGRVIRLAVAGELDLATVAAVDEAVARVLTCPGLKVLLVDFAAVTFCDSRGIAVLERGCAAATRCEIGFHLVNISPLVRRLLDVLGTGFGASTINATAAAITPVAANVRTVSCSPSNHQPSRTATTGFTKA
jgi:anti-sigma B factor antagonist